MVRTYRLSKGEAIPRTAYTGVWIVGLVCGAIFVFDGIARIVIVLFASLLFLAPFFEIFEATLDDQGVCEFRSLLRRKRMRADQVRSINGGPSDDPKDNSDIVIRYERGRVSLPGDDFLGLVQDLVAFNPAIKIDLAEGWFGRMLDLTPSNHDHTASDDPISELQRSYTKTLTGSGGSSRSAGFSAFSLSGPSSPS